ncbi:MAG: hypothetical protein JNL62_29945, partial [Bryobacterales bacterium]|nr:hypothetical protein [Bryobacterales bacterium]
MASWTASTSAAVRSTRIWRR